MIAPASISPYVAKASVVAGVHTGRLTSAASAHLPLDAATWNRAVPGFVVVAGKRTSTRSFAGTVTRRPFVVPPLGGSDWGAEPVPPEGGTTNSAFAARTATSTFSGWSVWFCTTTGNSTLSPKLRNRGALGLAIIGNRAVIADSPAPNCLSTATATAITRYRVRLSGSLTLTLARPLESVGSEAAKKARALKSIRARIDSSTACSRSSVLVIESSPPLALRFLAISGSGAAAGAGG